eukprot:4160250-Pleurochrysis_carterae.AAC.4
MSPKAVRMSRKTRPTETASSCGSVCSIDRRFFRCTSRGCARSGACFRQAYQQVEVQPNCEPSCLSRTLDFVVCIARLKLEHISVGNVCAQRPAPSPLSAFPYSPRPLLFLTRSSSRRDLYTLE